MDVLNQNALPAGKYTGRKENKVNKKESEINVQFFENLKWYCKNKGIRIGDLEQSIDVSKGYLSRLYGKSTLSVGKAYQIAQMFGVSLDDMLTKSIWKEEKERELREKIHALEEDMERLKSCK